MTAVKLRSMNMSVIKIEIPNKYDWILSQDELEKVISEFLAEYIELIEDMKLKKDLSGNKRFKELNKMIEKKLWDS
ncbi:MAG: hypothetical protein ACD_3C00192G0005 [uncultured bacterium (gcode 4)]|uniref:Uncharacterized protein n=1 Tax=uncultured bacterium (gcode 4) TaxID=1234023 RepID=K2GW46_9BACT|nr:MAG: hypothetical protein ACD_3C00192G0005 [uncultured bacterium (gcode 4)]